jgi:hypothetical protein
MTVEIDSRHPLLPKVDGENEDLIDFKGEKWKFLQIQVLSMLV